MNDKTEYIEVPAGLWPVIAQVLRGAVIPLVGAEVEQFIAAVKAARPVSPEFIASVDAFKRWQEADLKVEKLKADQANMLRGNGRDLADDHDGRA